MPINLLKSCSDRYQQNVRLTFMLLVLAGMTPFLVCAPWYLSLQQKIIDGQQKISLLQTKYVPHDVSNFETDDPQKNKDQIETIKKLEQQLHAIKQRSQQLAQFLIKIPAWMPDNVYLTALKISNQKIIITGIADTNDKIIDFLQNIMRNNKQKIIALNQIKSQTQDLVFKIEIADEQNYDFSLGHPSRDR